MVTSVLPERAPLRVSFEELLIVLDEIAACRLRDDAAGQRAVFLRERVASARSQMAELAARKQWFQAQWTVEGSARMDRYRQYCRSIGAPHTN